MRCLFFRRNRAGNRSKIIGTVLIDEVYIVLPCLLVDIPQYVYLTCIDFDIICKNCYTASILKYLFCNIHPK